MNVYNSIYNLYSSILMHILCLRQVFLIWNIQIYEYLHEHHLHLVLIKPGVWFMPVSSFFVFADIMSILCPCVNWLEIHLFRNQSKSRKYFQKSATKAKVFQPFALKINKNGLKKGHFLKTTLLKRKWSEEMNFQSLQDWSLAEGKFFLLDRLLLLFSCH